MSINFSKYKSSRKIPSRTEQEGFIGTKWGLLTVTGKSDKRMSSCVLYMCECDCGGETLATMPWLKRGQKTSCGCRRFVGFEKATDSIKTHEMSKTPTYKTWQSLRQRCENPNNDQYERYGGRGIKVCPSWASFEKFMADMGERPKNHTIDRIDGNGHYSPENCRWATSKTQSNNRRNSIKVKVEGEWMTVMDAAERLRMTESGVRNRIRRGAIEVRRDYEQSEIKGRMIPGGAFVKEGDQ